MRIPIARQVGNPTIFNVWEWEAHDAPTIFFFHATGFHGRIWDGVIQHLDDIRCYAVDARGHGLSDKPAPPHSWQTYGQDAALVTSILSKQSGRIIGVGHSVGGNSLVRAAAAFTNPVYDALLLVDPTIFPREFYSLKPEETSIDGHFILRRQRRWASPDEMIEKFKGRDPFKTWQPDILRAYAEYGLLPDGDEYVLACSPETEAHTYMSARLIENVDIYDAVAKIDAPVRILRADSGLTTSPNDLKNSPTAPDLASKFAHGDDYVIEGSSHFIPMESPEIIARHIREMIEKLK